MAYLLMAPASHSPSHTQDWHNMRRILCLVACASSAAVCAQTGVYTKAFDNARSGVNQNETALSQQSVMNKGMVRQTTIPVIGDARGMEAQPLILPKVTIADGSV